MRRVLFVFALSICSLVAWAYDFNAVAPTGQTLYYTITSDSTVEVSGDTTLSGALTIPGTVVNGSTTYSVTSIGDFAFYHCSSLTNVVIPNSVTDIGNGVFYNCQNLTSVIIPNSVTSIGYGAFYGCISLIGVDIPNSVTSIGDYAFSGCSSLTSINIPDGVTNIGISAFNSCSSLTSINIPDGVTSISGYVFYGCNSLTTMTIPNSVTSIGAGAFFLCRNLTSVTIGSGVTSIQNKAFMACNHLVSIVCNAVEPPTVADTNAFEGVWKGLPLIVPGESVGQYQSAYGWRDFTNIIGAPVGIEEESFDYKVYANNGCIAVSGAEGQTLRIYDVQGRLIISEKAEDNKLYAVPTTGVYMVQVGKHRAQKVVVGR